MAFVVGEALPEAGAVGFAFLDGDFEGGDAVLEIVDSLFHRFREQLRDGVDADDEAKDEEALAGGFFDYELKWIGGRHGSQELAVEDQWTVQLVPL